MPKTPAPFRLPGRRLAGPALLCGLAAAGALSLGTPSAAQTSAAANVAVNAASSLATMPNTGLGLNTAVWDGHLFDASVPGLLQNAGMTTLRYPGGSTSDIYHWKSNSITTGQSSYAFSSNTFDNFMGLVQKIGGSPVITVNYGSNAAGTAGADPSEAADWVDYANNTQHDGVQYWEIGNEVYGNGEYGAAWETDLHAGHTPATYGANVNAFAAAMKAKDPSIKVGAVLATPGNWPDGVSPDWNSNVLAACGGHIDFVIVHWYPQGPGSENDANLLADTGQIASMAGKVRALITRYCGANAPNVQIFVTESNSVSSSPGKQTVSLVNGLFAADNMLTWLENGVANVDWWALHNGSSAGNTSSGLYGTASFGDYGLLSNGSTNEPTAETPFPPYYGLQMVHALASVGDALLRTTSSQGLLHVHAARRADGQLSLMLINTSPSLQYATTVSVSGAVPSGTGTRSDYGPGSSGVSSSSFAVAGSPFTVSVPPYTLSVLTLPTAAADVTGQVKVTRSGFLYNRGTRQYTQPITLTNTGATGLSGPLSLVLDGLSGPVTLVNKTGLTTVAPSGSPYLNTAAGGLAPGGSATLMLTFSDPSNAAIVYSPRLLAGPGSR